MRNQLPMELEAPEKQYIFTGAIYSIVCFFSVPFILRLFSIGLERDIEALTWFDLAFHVLNFSVIVRLFQEYLSDSLLNFRLNKEQVISVVAIGSGLILAVGLIWHFLYMFSGSEILWLAGFGTIPMTETNLFVLSGDMVIVKPLFGTLCVLVLTPVTVCCLYYAVGFTPFYNIKPWLGYLMVCAVTAFPRICNIYSGWVADQQMVLYFAHLPVHLISCWAYKKTDTVWTPIIVHMIVNLISSLAFIFMYGF